MKTQKQIICPKCKKTCLHIHYYSKETQNKYPKLIGYAVHKIEQLAQFGILITDKCDFNIDYRLTELNISEVKK